MSWTLLRDKTRPAGFATAVLPRTTPSPTYDPGAANQGDTLTRKFLRIAHLAIGPYFAKGSIMRLFATSYTGILAFSILWLGFGCGGSVEAPTPSDPANTGSGSNSGSSSSGSGNVGNSALLADCNPGFPKAQASETKPCSFLANDVCYETQEAACGCICPREQGPVVCVTGYTNETIGGADVMWVTCHPTSG